MSTLDLMLHCNCMRPEPVYDDGIWYCENCGRDLQDNREIVPRIVCLCGSTRFSEAYQQANLLETLAGNIVLTIGCDMRSNPDLFTDKTQEYLDVIKAQLDELHKRKIELADEILVLNVGGYIGESTRSEIEHARKYHKVIRYLEPAES